MCQLARLGVYPMTREEANLAATLLVIAMGLICILGLVI